MQPRPHRRRPDQSVFVKSFSRGSKSSKFSLPHPALPQPAQWAWAASCSFFSNFSTLGRMTIRQYDWPELLR